MTKRLVFAACVAVSTAAFAATVTLDGETEYSVASDATQTVSDTLTGSGSILKKGDGTLDLTGVGNDFSGGVTVNAGEVKASALGALGSGTAEVAARKAGVSFNVAPETTGGYTTFANDLYFTGSEDCSYGTGTGVDGIGNGAGDGGKNAIFYQNTRLTGSISGTRSYRLRHNPKSTSSPFNGGPSTIFDGPLSVADGKGIFLNVYGTMTINGPVTASILSSGEAWSGGGTLILSNAANRIGRLYVAMPRIYCGDTNVLRGAELVWRVTSEDLGSYDCSWIDLDGHDQTVAALRQFLFNSGSTYWNKTQWQATGASKYFLVKSTKPATLTITGMDAEKEAFTMVRGAISLVLDAQEHPSFTQIFTHTPSTFTGTTTVRAGTLSLTGNARFTETPSLTVETGGTFVTASTNALASLEKVTNLVVRGVFDASTARVNPFDKTLENLEIASGATLKLPEGSIITVKSLTAGGQTITAGRFTAAQLATLAGATVSGMTVYVASATKAVSWTGAVSEMLSATGNWDPALASSVEVGCGSLLPTFASSGARATVDAEAAFAGMTFRAADGATGFTLARDATPHGLTLLGDKVNACSNNAAATAHTYVIDAPLAMTRPATFHADKNQTLILSNAFHDTALANTYDLTIDGRGSSAPTDYGKIVFAGTNYYGGALTSTTSLWRVSGKLANPGDAYTGNPKDDYSNAIRLNIAGGGFSSATSSYGIELDNAVVGKSILVNNVMGARSLTALANTTNEITGFLCYNPATSNHQGVAINSKAEIILSGGLYASHSFRIYGGGTLRIRDKPVTCLCSAGFNPSSGTAIFEVPGNNFVYMLLGYNNQNATVEMKVNHVMTNGVVEVGGDGGNVGTAVDSTGGTQTLDLHCTTQRCAYVAVRKRGILKGEYPAMLEVYEGRPSLSAKANYVIIGRVEGGVGFNLCGTGDLVFTNQAFTSCGDLVVSKGVMEFASNATWLNGTNVTVTGDGTLKLAAGARFNGRKAVLHLGADAHSWKIDIPSGQEQVFSYAYDSEGRQLPAGTYGKAETPGVTRTRYAAHFTGDGLVRVLRHGFVLSCR